MKMSAWRWQPGMGAPRIEQVDVPRPGVGEVVIAVRAAGLCHSDVGMIDDPRWANDLSGAKLTLGHETAGTVARLGQDVESVSVGDVVCVHPLGSTIPGYDRDGGFAEFATAPSADLVPVPGGVPLAWAAVATDAGMTSHRAVAQVGGVEAGMRVGVIGLGGVGQFGARIAAILGAEVVAADPRPEARALGQRLELARVVETAAELAGEDFDVVVDFVGGRDTVAEGAAAVVEGGRIVLVGMHSDLVINPRAFIHRGATLAGSRGGGRDDIAAVLDFMRRGLVTPHLEQVAFDDIGAALDRLRAGQVNGRAVAVRH